MFSQQFPRSMGLFGAETKLGIALGARESKRRKREEKWGRETNLFGLAAKSVCFGSSEHKVLLWEGRKDVRHKHYNKPKDSVVSLGLSLQRDFLVH